MVQPKLFEERMHEFSSSQVNLPIVLEQDVVRCGLAIDGKLLYLPKVNPRETNPHVTIRYGLQTVNPDRVRELVASLPAFEIVFGDMDIFSPEREVFDVLHVKVSDSPGAGGLVNLRRRLDEILDPAAPQWFPKYVPHVTIAYMCRGAADFMKGQPCLITGRTMKVHSIIYSDKRGFQHECELAPRVEHTKLGLAGTYQFYNEKL